MRTIVKDVLYYKCNREQLKVVTLIRSEYILSESISNDLIKSIQVNDYKAVFIGAQNIFSHSMNVLRKVVNEKDMIIVIGVNSILNKLAISKECTLELKKNKVIVDDIEYIFF